MPVRLEPIERKMRVSESAIRTKLDIEKLAEVVDVQLQQVAESVLDPGQQRSLRCGLLSSVPIVLDRLDLTLAMDLGMQITQ